MSIEKKIKMLLCIGTAAFYGMNGLEAADLVIKKSGEKISRQENHTGSVLEYLVKVQNKIDTKGLSSIMDFTGMMGQAPGWAGYPEKNTTAKPADYKIAKLADPSVLAANPKFDDKGFEPRNLDKNEKQLLLDPKRQAMPTNLPDPSRSLFKKNADGTDSKKLRRAVREWLTIRYRGELSLSNTDPHAKGEAILSNDAALRLIEQKGLTYNNIWFWTPEHFDQLSKQGLSLAFDDKGRPINPYGDGKDINVTDRGFYFFYGENPAVDLLLTIEHEGKMYSLMIKRADMPADIDGSKKPKTLAFPAGMADIDDQNKVYTGIRELGEEVGLTLDETRFVLEDDKTKSHENMKEVELIYTGIVDGESRATRNAWTATSFYHIHFNGLNELVRYIKNFKLDHKDFETAGRYFLDVRYVLQNHIMPGAVGDTFAGGAHGRLFTLAMNKFLEKDSTRARFFSEEGYNPGFKESGIELDYMEDNLIFKKPGETLAHMAEVKIEKKLRKIDEKIKKLKEQEQEQNKIQKTEEK